jgi:hypothetical protein
MAGSSERWYQQGAGCAAEMARIIVRELEVIEFSSIDPSQDEGNYSQRKSSIWYDVPD